MASGVVEVSTIESKEVRYGFPTLRYCKVCELIDHMDFDQADRVRASLGDDWHKIFEIIKSNSKEYGFSEIKSNEDDPSQDYHEGPSIVLPEFEARLSFSVKVRASITVCVPPHHSKLWTRISYMDEDDGISFSEDKLNEFYNKAAFACEKFAGLLLDEYKKALEKNSVEVNDKLVPVHEIQIETTSSDSRKIGDLIKDDSIKMAAILENEQNFRLLSGFVSRAYGRNVSDIEDSKRMPSDFQWFKMKVSRPSSENLVGIYSKEQKDRGTMGRTIFVGLVDGSSSSKMMGRITQEFSKKLVQHIAPVI